MFIQVGIVLRFYEFAKRVNHRLHSHCLYTKPNPAKPVVAKRKSRFIGELKSDY
jgi:hypothetical protein